MTKQKQFAEWYNIPQAVANDLFATYTAKPRNYRELFRPYGSGNAKIDKAGKRGYHGAVLHLAPAKSSGYETCAWRTAACTELCLNKSGHAEIPGSMEMIHRARIAKTRFYFEDRQAFIASMLYDAFRLLKYGATHGIPVCLRPNGTSDLVDIAHRVAKAFPMLEVYDYTKRPKPERYQLANYSLTFSYSGENWPACQDALEHGVNVTVIFGGTTKAMPLPETYRGYPVLDGDVTDLRFLDPKGHIVGLRPKGRKAKAATNSPFLVSQGEGKTERLLQIGSAR